MPVVRVIGCGNPGSGDDAAGLVAVRRARDALRGVPGVEIYQAGPALQALGLLEGAAAAVIVDAVRAPDGGRTPGTVVRAEAGRAGLPADLRSSLSSHGLGIAETVALAGALDDPPRIVLLGVEADDVQAGHPLSPAVSGAMPALVAAIVAEARAMAAPERGVSR